MRRRAAGCWLVGLDSVLIHWQEQVEKELDSGWAEDSVGLEEASTMRKLALRVVALMV